MKRVVYTDGACSGNPGPGGWAWAERGGAYASGFEPHTTNQRMEVQAALEAVRSHPGPLEVVSDSTYVVNCFRQSWWKGWLARGWINSQREPVKNRDLWEPLVELVRTRGDVSFRWVKGHSGDTMNDLVDRLAVEAIQRRRGSTSVDAARREAERPVPARPTSGPGAENSSRSTGDASVGTTPARRAFSVAVYPRHAGRVLLIRHARLGKWLPPGGELEPGESPLEAARRELLEETGLTGLFPALSDVEGTPPGLIGYEEHDAGSKGTHLNFVFVADVDTDAVTPNGEFTEHRWVTLDDGPWSDAPRNVEQLARRALGQRQRGSTP